MQPIDKKLKSLQEEINLWSDLLLPNIQYLNELDGTELSKFYIGQGIEEGEISAEFAVESLLTAFGRFKEVLRAGGSFWPENSERFNLMFDHPTGTIIKIFQQKIKSHDDLPWFRGLLYKRTEGIADRLSQDEDIGVMELFSMVHRLRRALAKESVLRFGVISFDETIMGRDSLNRRMEQRVNLLSRKDQKTFRRAVKRYLSNEYLFPWLMEERNMDGYEYASLFRLAGLEERVMSKSIDDIFEQLFGDSDINDNMQGVVRAIIERIAAGLAQIGRYDELVEQIVSSGGQWGEDSLVGAADRINILPAQDDDGSCHEILLAFAQGRRSPKHGLKTILRKVREHLIRCGNSGCMYGESTRIAIIFSDVWDPEVFSESSGDFQAHREGNPPKVIFGVLVNGDQLFPQPIN